MNSTICSMWKTITDKEKTTWKDYINKLYCTKHSSIGYFPYHLLFGYKPRLPIDLIDHITKIDHITSYDQYLPK